MSGCPLNRTMVIYVFGQSWLLDLLYEPYLLWFLLFP
jgi:hypothetical protein